MCAALGVGLHQVVSALKSYQSTGLVPETPSRRESATVSKQKFPPSMMVLAVIGPNHKSRLLFVPGTINTDKYIQNLEDAGFIKDLDARYGALQWIFQQDGAPCHTSQESLD
jgi:hypothetical protein